MAASLEVTVVESVDIPTADAANPPEYYVVVAFGSESFSTTTCPGKLNPQWKSTWTFMVSDAVLGALDRHRLDVALWNRRSGAVHATTARGGGGGCGDALIGRNAMYLTGLRQQPAALREWVTMLQQ